tara:strand:+ start:143 stop:340 length:198 start_codon:yes stop_codon:yes gene_type:complete
MGIDMNEKATKKLSLIDELLIEDVSSMSIDELEENISILKEIIKRYSNKIEEKRQSQRKAENLFQ